MFYVLSLQSLLVPRLRLGTHCLRGSASPGSVCTLRTTVSLNRHQLRQHQIRAGQSLVEFAIVALVLYMLIAAILTFGHMLYCAQGLQSAADLAARELSRTPLRADITFDLALGEQVVKERIYNPDFLVFDLDTLAPDQNFFQDVVSTWPLLNQQLATLMIVDRPDLDGDGTPDRKFIRYPGALLTSNATPTGYTVGIPLVTGRNGDGIETIRWVPIVEQIKPPDPNNTEPEPFQLTNELTRGVVALRINYPFQSASMSSFRPDPTARDFPFEATVGRPNAADDGAVTESSDVNRPGDLTGSPLSNGEVYAGTYGGQYGLGAQGALSATGRPIRPYRRVISAQAIYRREIFE